MQDIFFLSFFFRAYSDDVDPDEDVDRVVVRDVLKHSHAGVKVPVSGHVVCHFVHAQRALTR